MTVEELIMLLSQYSPEEKKLQVMFKRKDHCDKPFLAECIYLMPEENDWELPEGYVLLTNGDLE